MNKKKTENQKMNKFAPKKWRKMKLGDVLTFQRGYDLPREKMCNGQFPVAGSNGIIGYHNTKTTTGPGVTVGRSGSIGEPIFYKNDFWAHNTTLYIKNFYGNDERFIFYLIQTLNLSKLNSGSAVPSLNRNYIHELEVIIPPLSEQKEIVEILSTWDQAIENLDKLILSKQKQFKWLLKKLITDQKNNPKWKKEKLEKVLNYEQPTNYIVDSTKYSGEYKTPVLTAGKTFIIGYTNETEGVFPISKLPVIIFDDFTTSRQFVDFPFKVKSSAMKILLPRKEKANIKFLFHSMNNIKFEIKSHKRFWISQYSKIKVPIPSLSEQKRIVEIIFKWEKEIEIFKQLSKKYQEQKKGLMQKLLTGKIRLQ